jgi:hypothetical protein
MSVETTTENRIGPSPDRDEILRVLRLYTDGFGSHHPEMMKEAFHPASHVYWTNPDGSLHEGSLYEESQEWAMEDGGPVEGRIIETIQAGDVAVVVLGFDVDNDPERSWLDIHTLLRLDGTWKVMAKTATHASRADWAGLGASSQTPPRDRLKPPR